MPPKKQVKVSLTDFLLDESTGKVNWADDFDDLPAAPPTRDDRYQPKRGGDFLSSVPDRVDRDRMAAASRGGPGADYDRGPPREELPLPTKAPFTAFIGNLSFEVTESEVEEFFAGAKTVGIRLIERDGKPKGYGYVEFETLDGLKEGLARSGTSMGSRTVRVSVAEAPKASAGGFGPSVAEEASQWRRAGPLPPSADSAPRRAGPPGSAERPGFGRFESSQSSSGGGFDSMEVGAGGRSGFGSRFTPTPSGGARDAPPHVAGAGGPGAPRRQGSVGGAAEGAPSTPQEPTAGDEAANWRTGKPVEALAPPPGAPRRPSGAGPLSAAASGGPADRSQSFRKGGDATEVDDRFASQERMGFGSKFTASPTPPESPAPGTAAAAAGAGASAKRAGFGFDRRGSPGSTPGGAAGPGPSGALSPTAGDEADTWRNARRPAPPSRGQSQAGGERFSSPAPPAERKKLELKPRSTPPTTANESAAASTPLSPDATSGSRANPFGNAKPVDAAERERLIEEKMAQREKERQAKREKEKADREAAHAAAPNGPRGTPAKSTTAADADAEAASAADAEGTAAPASADAASTPKSDSTSAAAAAAPAAPKAPITNPWRKTGSPAPPKTPSTPAAAAAKEDESKAPATANSNSNAKANSSSKASSAKAGSQSGDAASNATSSPRPAPAAAAPAPKTPAPTGAWGVRKPSGALVGAAAAPAAKEAEKEKETEVESVTKGVEAASVKDE